MQTLVYKYGLATPHENLDKVLDQMYLAHRYRNVLTEIERARRVAERALIASSSQQIAMLSAQADVLEKEIQRLLREIKKERSRTRKRSESQDLKSALQVVKAAKAETVRVLRETRKAQRETPALVAARDVLSELVGELRCGARALSGLAKSGPHYGAWGTYQLVEEAAQQAFAKTSIYAEDGVTPNDPKFERWTGEGAVSVQIQGGATLADVTGDHSQLRITLPDERAWLKMPGNGWTARHEYARHGELSMCLGTDAEGSRIYGTWRLDMHRPLPKDAIIKRATVSRRVEGPSRKWSLELTITCEMAPVQPATVGGEIALDVGWRVIGNEVRVAGWKDSHGNTGDVRLDVGLLRQLHEPEEIRSKRDSLFDLELMRLKRWLDTYRELPEWILKSTEGIALWKSPARLVTLRNAWREARFVGDEIAFASLDAWANSDLYYWGEEASRRGSALRRRRELYRVFAAHIAEKYNTIVIEQFDLRSMATRKDETENETARSNRQLVAVSNFRIAVKNAARSRGRVLVAMPAHDTTRTCPTCGLVSDRPAAEDVVLKCECGAVWDQDTDGASEVLLRRWRERPGDVKVLVGAREEESAVKTEGRRDRVRRLRGEKMKRMASAREAVSEGAE